MPIPPKKYSLTALFSTLFVAVFIFNVILLYFSYGRGTISWLHFTTIAASSIFFLAALLIFLRLIARPLNQLTDACRKIRKGNLEALVKIKSKNEIGELIATFNGMITDLKESQAALKEARDILEIKVMARTEELQELVNNQEGVITEKTKELKDRIEKLERFRRLTVGRELKMIELKGKLREFEHSEEMPI